MKVSNKPQIEFSAKEYQLVAKFVDMCDEMEDLFNGFDELCDIPSASSELDNATGIEWEQFCEIVHLLQDFVHENIGKD